MDIGEFISTRRKALGNLSQDELARRIGVSRQTLYKWTNNASDIRVKNIIRLARALQVHPVEVLRIASQEIISYPVYCHPKERHDDNAFISETIPDGTVVGSGATFEKSWVIRNIGKVVWRERKLICQDLRKKLFVLQEGNYIPFHSCTLTPHKNEIEIPYTKPGDTVELVVRFTAPFLPGRAISIWKMADNNNELCYPNKSGVWCDIIVSGFF